MLKRTDAIAYINELSAHSIPFFFFTDFEGTKAWVKPTSEITTDELRFDFQNHQAPVTKAEPIYLRKHPVDYPTFQNAFQKVLTEINQGNSYLTNLTFKTPIETNWSLQEVYENSQARYKLLFQDQFVVFSPETFISIQGGKIYSHPMKGTIDDSIPNAAQLILADHKEMAEHVTIVDLIRNDLSKVAKHVSVTNFRYLSKIKTHEKTLLQVSSEITGELPHGYQSRVGNILFDLLPAGSISGAPKKKTMEIIKNAEGYQRGFYTGICGHFDGKNLDTAVMIRFIEKETGRLYYKSGGGITSLSDPKKEYQEFIDKIYVPVY